MNIAVVLWGLFFLGGGIVKQSKTLSKMNGFC